MAERIVSVEDMQGLLEVFGSFDENLTLIQREYGVTIVSRDNGLHIGGEEEAVYRASRVVDMLIRQASSGEAVGEQAVRYVMRMVDDGAEDRLGQLGADCICITAQGKPVKSRTMGQKKYIECIEANTITFGIGPAGTGKTYLAVAMAVTAFRKKDVNRIILTRPAVEAGEKLGFLPGDLQTKVDPYLRPLYDGLHDMLGSETFKRYLDRNSIEVAPLAYMRGRTLEDSFIILDEAQNTTCEQMKMFLTRLGMGSKAVVTGDVTQIDLPAGKKSGLVEAERILRGVEGIGICRFTERDVVRHPLVQRIVQAYERHEAEAAKADSKATKFKAIQKFRRN